MVTILFAGTSTPVLNEFTKVGDIDLIKEYN